MLEWIIWCIIIEYPADILTFFQRCLFVDMPSRRGTTSN